MTPIPHRNIIEGLNKHILQQTAYALMGDEPLYDNTTDNIMYDELYSTPNTITGHSQPPRIIVKALRAYMVNNSIDYNILHKRVGKILFKISQTYDFGFTNEKLTVDPVEQLMQVSYGESPDRHMQKLVKIGVSGRNYWMVTAGRYSNIDDPNIPYNFFTSIYKHLFRVPENIRAHIVSTIPNIRYPSILLESYIYLRYLTMPEQHYDKTCEIAISKYNKNLEKYEQNVNIILPIQPQLRIDETINKKAQKTISYETLLLTLLCFPASCNNEEIMWELISYTQIYNLVLNILTFERPDSTIIAGRIISEEFYKDMHKALFMKVNSTIFKPETPTTSHNSEVFTGSNIKHETTVNLFTALDDEIINYMASGLPSNMWFDSSELPASWIALL